MFEGFFDATLGKVLLVPDIGPFPTGLFLISLILTGMITLIYKYATDQDRLKQIKKEVKEIQKDIKAVKGDQQKMMELNKIAMEKNFEMMKSNFKPMIYTFIPIIFIFGWLRGHYEGLGNPDVLFGLTWIWTYIIFSMVLSIILRKILKMA